MLKLENVKDLATRDFFSDHLMASSNDLDCLRSMWRARSTHLNELYDVLIHLDIQDNTELRVTFQRAYGTLKGRVQRYEKLTEKLKFATLADYDFTEKQAVQRMKSIIVGKLLVRLFPDGLNAGRSVLIVGPSDDEYGPKVDGLTVAEYFKLHCCCAVEALSSHWYLEYEYALLAKALKLEVAPSDEFGCFANYNALYIFYNDLAHGELTVETTDVLLRCVYDSVWC